jgi:hypothetical protein
MLQARWSQRQIGLHSDITEKGAKEVTHVHARQIVPALGTLGSCRHDDGFSRVDQPEISMRTGDSRQANQTRRAWTKSIASQNMKLFL